MNLSQAGLGLAITMFLVIWLVAQIWSAVKRPTGSAVSNLLLTLAVLYVGWTLRGWPTRPAGAGLMMTLLIAWKDSVLLLLYSLAKLIGLVQIWDKWFEPFWK
jgi:hypothetical protein